jgi:hypothetical protein
MKICINHIANHVIIQAYDENGYWRQEFPAWGKKKVKANGWLLNLPPEQQNQIAKIIKGLGTWSPNKSSSVFVVQAKLLPGFMQEVQHPVTSTSSYLGSVIMNLNDIHQWSREQIADWIETLDPVPTFEVK